MNYLTQYKKRDRCFTHPVGESMTEQSHQGECEINNILAKYQKSGMVSHLANHQPRYDDCTSHDFTAAMNIVIKSQEMFDDLPSQVRAKFGNNPVRFMDYVQDPDNADSLHELGIVNPPDPTAKTDLPVTAPSGPAAPDGAPPSKSEELEQLPT